MEASDLTQLFEYVADSRRRFLTAFRELGCEEFSKDGRPRSIGCTASSCTCSRWRNPTATMTFPVSRDPLGNGIRSASIPSRR